jgi:FAD/FMN-containing dehydrogenase
MADFKSPLSAGASITGPDGMPLRWSSFGAPKTAAVVNVATENDVSLTVKYCNQKGIPFVVQNGGVGWATSFTLTNGSGVLINIAGLNQTIVSADKKTATIGGGASIGATISAAFAAGVQVVTGNCNCVGTLGGILGGGFGNLMGVYGMGIDNILSVRLVKADGNIVTVSPTQDADLFWAIRGAGPNMGVVTSAVVKAYPVTPQQNMAWSGAVIFTPDKLEQVVQVIDELDLEERMNIFLYYTTTGAPDFNPIVLTTVFLYNGDSVEGHTKFAKLFAVGPIVDATQVIPYNTWNSGADPLCARGARKPAYGVGFQRVIPSTWREVWNQYVEFLKTPGVVNSLVLLEAYSTTKLRTLPGGETAYPHRNVNFHAAAIAWYDDASLDGAAKAWGSKVRDTIRSTDQLAQNSTYVNFAHGDEALSVIYGSSLARLKTIKKRVDPNNRFNQWYNIK